MSQTKFTGHGSTFEEAFAAAARTALENWKPVGPDDLAIVHAASMAALYGGFVGFSGTRVVEVELGGSGPVTRVAAAGGAGGQVAPAAKLALKFDVLPDVITANLMPPVRRPQPHRIGMVLTVSNIGAAPYTGQSPDSAKARPSR